MRARILAAILAVAGLAPTAGTAQTLAADFKGSIEFEAPTYATLGEFRAGRGQPGKAAFYLWFPETGSPGDGPFPAVIVGHSIGGWNEGAEGYYVKFLLEAGYAVAGLDHFGPRDIKRAADVPGAINPITPVSDALLALKLLATHPRIRPDRIGVTGLSMGGITAEASAYEFVRRRVLGDSPLKFAAHMPLYAPCTYFFSTDGRPATTGAPVQLLYAGRDETTPRAKCERIDALIRAADPQAQRSAHWYPDAHHAWDRPMPPRFFAHHVNAHKCPITDMGAGGPRFIDDDGTARPFSGKELQACMKASSGYTMGHNAEAYADAPKRMLAFFGQHLRD